MLFSKVNSMAIVPIKKGEMSHQMPEGNISPHNKSENKVAKANLRGQLLARRTALTPQQRQLRSEQLTRELMAWLTDCVEQTATIALYWAFKAEVDLQPLMDRWRAQGGRVVLPIVREKNAPLLFAPYRGLTSMHSGAYGILEPMYDEADLIASSEAISVLFAPCVGFNRAGYRLGYGGGYYDRTLANWREQREKLPITVGVADDWAQVDLRPDAFDVALDVLALTDG